MKRRLFKTMVAVLAIAAAAAGPVRGQTTYNVTFGGFAEPAMNTTVSVTSLPQTFTQINNTYVFYPWKVISTTAENYTSASVTSGGNGKVSATIANSLLSITVSGTFEGTATIHVDGSYWDPNHDSPVPLSCDITVACTLPPAPPVPHTVRFASGNDGWTVTDVDSARSATAPAVLQNVMAGDSLVVTAPATLPGKVKSVKVVKYVVPPTPLDNTTTAWTAGTYAVPAGGLTYSAAITVSGNVTLVLTDGETLNLNKGISLAEGATLTVEGNGTMNVNGTNESTASTVAGTGTLVLTSGTLTATGGNGGNIGMGTDDSHGGNGGDAINGSVIVSGGTLTAWGGNGGSVDFMCDNCSGGNGGKAISGSVIVSGGSLTARGGNGGSVGDESDDCSGGNGGVAISGTLTINGGSTSVNNGSNGSIGEDCDHCSAGTGGKAVAGTVTDNR